MPRRALVAQSRRFVNSVLANDESFALLLPCKSSGACLLDVPGRWQSFSLHFFNTSLTRTLRSQATGSAVEFTEPAPWSAPVAGNPLPDHLDLGNGHYVIAIDWKLQANYRNLHDHEMQPYRLRVSASANQVLVDGQALSPQTLDALKTRLRTAFKDSLEHFNRHRVRRHRRHPWHRRLWRVFFPGTNLTTRFLIVEIVVLVLAILLALVAGQIGVGR